MAILADYVDIINTMDYQAQFEIVNLQSWIELMPNYEQIIRNMSQNEYLRITRNDLYTLGQNIQNNNNYDNLVYEFIIKVLMWGYPTRSRLSRWIVNNNNYILNICECIVESENYNEFVCAFNEVNSLGQSTYTKFLHFLQIENDDHFKCQILDNNIRAILNSGVFDEFNDYNLNNRIYYNTYIRAMNEISTHLQVNVEKIEMFLFSLRVYGNQLVLNQPKIILNQ